MAHIELPRVLENYFAFAELDPTRNGRRFTITLPYFDGTRLDRLQWWYHVSTAHEQIRGEAGICELRSQAIERFSRHITRWLQNTGQRLYGDDPIPRIGPLKSMGPLQNVAAERAQTAATAAPETPPGGLTFPMEKVANG